MIIPGNKIKEIEKLKEILAEIQSIISATPIEDIKSQVVVNDWSDTPESSCYGNWNFSLYNKHYMVPTPPAMFKNIEDKLGTIPDVFQSFINFMAPNTVLPTHCDDENNSGNFGTLRAAGFKCYQITAGVQIPSNNAEVCGLNIDGFITNTEQGSIVAFDGTKPHNGWNRSDSWRITWIVDMYKTGFLD
jgi:Aspartyl/Asparaginyl beta-hydroxylase